MDSEKKQEQQPSGMSGWLIAVIVISITAVVGTLLYFFVYKKRANSFKNVGSPNAGVAAPPAVPSMTNVTGGNMGATGGNARPSVNAAAPR
jgi:flagellar basal body-associated protein FliL